MWSFSDLTRFQELIENDVFKGKLLDCSYNNLKSLKGSPEIIEGGFNCSWNNLESLEFSPKKILYGFSCNYNKLKSLKGSPQQIGSNFFCYKNNLETLEGCPKKINGKFDCSHNNLKSLEHSPKEINGSFNCVNNKIKDIKKEIIKYQIKAESYETDEGIFTFEDIKEEFEIFSNIKLKIKNKNIDYGLGI